MKLELLHKYELVEDHKNHFYLFCGVPDLILRAEPQVQNFVIPLNENIKEYQIKFYIGNKNDHDFDTKNIYLKKLL
jgi:hypothetical protein